MFRFTKQDEAVQLARRVCNHFRLEPREVILGPVAHAKNQHVVGHFRDKELIQQSDYWLRPMAFHTEAERPENINSCLVSTVNFAEWDLGWMSQFLDIFNLMPIIDLHKSEVYALAKLLNVPKEVTNTPPKGGLANSQTDEQALGFTYAEYEDLKAYKTSTISYETKNLIEKRIKASEYKRKRFNENYVFAIKNLIKDMKD